MKSIVASVFFALSFALAAPNAHAITWSVVGKDTKPLAEGTEKIDLAVSVGKTTVAILGKVPGLQVDADETGVASINGLKSETKWSTEERWVRAYGWCYSINGKVPDAYASEVHFTSQDDRLVWFYGFALYEDGKWKSYCNSVAGT